jgi:2-dehydro-3-deoxygalactonokinase
LAGSFIACDWGTSNMRAWRIGATGLVEASCELPLGVSTLKPGEPAQRFNEQIRPAVGGEGLPAILCGMIGSTLGWLIAPYAPCPADLADVAAAMVEPEPGVRIVPGVSGPGVTGAPDVMRGEETQILGWLALDPARLKGRHVVCHPGTHAKWALVEDGRIVRFVTAMTGELFALLRKHSVLKTDAKPDDERAFDEGQTAAGDGDALSARLFSVRTRVVASDADPQSSASYLSGLLIGSECAALPGLLGIGRETAVALIGEPALCVWYERALRQRGFGAAVYDGDEAVLAGLRALHRIGADA